LLTAGGRQTVEACAPVVVRDTPLSLHPAFDGEALEGRVERALLDLEHVVGRPLDVPGYAVAMQRLAVSLERLEDQQLQGAGHHFGLL
jgi:hypothetical protein